MKELGDLTDQVAARQDVGRAAEPDFLRGGGEMGVLMRAMDWASTPLGAVESWPQSLRTTVSLCLSSTFPILIAWGPERVQIYNDSYRPICGEKHPRSMGQAFNECWASALPVVGSIVDKAQAGEGSYIENLRMFLDRYGYLEEAWMTFSFSPVRDESGGIGGLFHPITEVTEKLLGARRTQVLRELAAQVGKAKTLAEAWELTAQSHDSYQLDLPFLLFYRCDEAATAASLVGAVGLPAGSPGAPELVDLAEPTTYAWPLARALRSGQPEQVDDVEERLASLPCGPYPEPPRSAILLPIHPPGAPGPVGCLVAGVSARRALDAAYRAFYETLGSTLTTAVTTVRAYEQEQRRAEELAALDRAKTAFFGNVSHEFRTPLTLMIGPIEDGLADVESPLSSVQRDRQVLVHRNSLRLLKLVNTLLDFSRIEAGRAQVSFAATDLAELTQDLASNFESVMANAGLKLVVDCPPLPEPVWVDREIWEKIVLNLLSNAFKFTFEGEVRVRLQPQIGGVVLTVEDTGTGIAAGELPRLFERFHRVEGARGRSFEGSGIGLALVQELTRLHGGEVGVESTIGRGTAFRVALRSGNEHLPQDRLNATTSRVSTSTGTAAYLEEAAGWLTDAQSEQQAPASDDRLLQPRVKVEEATPTDRSRVLLVDDNADMRAYVRRLLEGRYAVEVAENGLLALEAVRAEPPDLVLSDVMMPGLDGFGLVRALKKDPKTASVPVILLSARAGEEATIEGIRAGASDYLVKPFGARELAARVESNIQLARVRNRLSEVLESMGDAFYVVDRDWRFILVNAMHEQLTRASRSHTLGRSVWEVFPEAADAKSRYWSELHRCMEERTFVHFAEYYEPLDLWTDVRAHPTTEGIAVFFRDISEERRAAEVLRQQAEFSQQLVGIVSHDLRNPLSVIQMSTAILMQCPGIDASAMRTIVRIQSSVTSATKMVGDLLDFTQARLGQGIPVTRTATDLHEVVGRAVEDVQSAFPDREITFHSEGLGDGTWDGERLSQVIHNLVTNALKYSRPSTPVTVSSRVIGDEASLEVHNTGDPIPAALQSELFKPLRRGLQGTTRAGGIGLGLFIVEHIVRAHGGTVTVRSTAEEGTTFSVFLPRGGGP